MPNLSTAVLCVPGGMLSRRYFHYASQPGGSLADVLTHRGIDMLAVDVLGAGDNRPDLDGDSVDLAAAAESVAATARELRRDHDLVVGLGHSLGAWLTVAAADQSACFDGVALMGYAPAWRWTDIRPALDRAGLIDLLAATQPDFCGTQLVRFPSPAPRELVTPLPRGLAAEFGSGNDSLRSAAALDIPVWLGYGSADVATACTEAGRYLSAPSVDTFVLPGAGHLHATEPNATVMWQAVADWVANLAMIKSTDERTT